MQVWWISICRCKDLTNWTFVSYFIELENRTMEVKVYSQPFEFGYFGFNGSTKLVSHSNIPDSDIHCIWYAAVYQKEGWFKKNERGEKLCKEPRHTAINVGSCPAINRISRTNRLWQLPRPSPYKDHPTTLGIILWAYLYIFIGNRATGSRDIWFLVRIPQTEILL